MFVNLTDQQTDALRTLIDLELGASESSRIDAWRELETLSEQLDSGEPTPIHIVLQRHAEDDIAIEVERVVGPFLSCGEATAWIVKQAKDDAIEYEANAVEAPAANAPASATTERNPQPSCPAATVLWHGVLRDDSDAPQPAGYSYPIAPVQVEQGSLEPTSLGIVATWEGAKIEIVVELRDDAIHVLGYTPADDDPAINVYLTESGATEASAWLKGR